MGFKLFNTESKKLEQFNPVEKGKVKIYVCGPTVNDVPHLGHARQQITFDVLRRYLEYQKFDVTFVSNITDIDDKIIRKAEQEKITIEKLTKMNLKAHEEDYKSIEVRKPDIQPKATEYIQEMVDLIKILEDKGFAYVIADDGVYYNVAKFKQYGKLSGQKIKNLKAGARINVKNKKRNKEDFVMWKFSKLGEPEWESPWGKGRPGWHIECSAMSAIILGLPLDIHGGGQDLIFPHHEDEVAQSEVAYGKKLANYWMHNGMVNVDKVKMSKSLGNLTTIRALLKKYSGGVLRYFVISSLYRKPIDFSENALDAAKTTHGRLKTILENLEDDGKLNQKYLDKFNDAMDDDLNTPIALSVVWQLMRAKDEIGKYQTIKKIDSVLGLNLIDGGKIVVPSVIQKLIKERDQARNDNNWKLADQKRDEILELGWQVKDTKTGTNVKPN